MKYLGNFLATAFIFGLIYVSYTEALIPQANVWVNSLVALVTLGLTHYVIVPFLSDVAAKHAGGDFAMQRDLEGTTVFGVYLLIVMLIVFTNV